MTALPKIGRPAERALEHAGYRELEQISGVAEADLLRLHGFGPRGIQVLRAALDEHGLPPMRRSGSSA
jgi:hypothetical protein